MSLTTYDGLKQAVADYLDRDDLSEHIVDFITLAEARHRREIRFIDMLVRAQVTMTEGQLYVALPTDYLEMRNLRLMTDPPTVMENVSPEKLTTFRSEHLNDTTGIPKYYTVHEEIELDIGPSDTWALELLYYAPLAALSEANTTNALLTKHPDAYLYAALLAATPFLMHDERITTWAELYAAAKEGIKGVERRRRHGVPLVARAHGATP